MKVFAYFLPLLTVLLLLVYFMTLPDLNRCRLPGKGSRARSRALSRRDALPILLITGLYACTAFFRLGADNYPVTPCGTFDVYLSVGRVDGTPVYELPLADSDGHRRYRIGKITFK